MQTLHAESHGRRKRDAGEIIMRDIEEREQIAIFTWAKMQEAAHPDLCLMYHIPNGGKRGKVEAARLKAAGVKAGIPDICLPVPHGGYAALYIELKTPEIKALGVHKGRPSERQKKVIAHLRERGNCAVVCYGAEEAIKTIKGYLNDEISNCCDNCGV